MILTERQAKRSMWCPMARIRWMNVWQASNRSNPGRWNRVKNALFRTFFLPAPALAGSGEVFQMLGLRMHDVEVG